jgi:hypothetical protein
MGLPERIIAKYERDAWVQALTEGGVDEYYRPLGSATTVAQIKLAVIEDPTALARIDAGLVQAGSLLAYVRKEYSQHIQPKTRVWWDDASNSTGTKYEVQRVEDYREKFGQLGGFQRVTLARIEL